MKKQNHINLETLARGAFAEKLNEALQLVAENIQNPNTAATEKRGITINIKFAPNKARNLVNTSISVTTKLAATEAIDTQMVMGQNLKTGAVEFAEYDSANGQISFLQPEPEEETAEEQTAAPEMESQQPERVLDLRSRARKQEASTTPMPGRDFDEETGELYETTGQVVPFKAVQA